MGRMTQRYRINLLILIVLICAVNADWIKSELQTKGKMYFWSEDEKSWEESRLECLKNGWQLATVLTVEDNNNLRQFVESTNKTTWIGLHLTNYSPPEGEWVDGSLLTFNSSGFWADSEPMSNKPCVNLWKEENFTWDDSRCTRNLNFVCETRIVMSDGEDFQDAGAAVLDVASQPSNEETMQAASNALDQFLRQDSANFKQNENLSRNVLNAFDDFVARYQGEDFVEQKENLNIAVKKAGNRSMVLGNDSSTDSQVLIDLTQELLDELRLKTGNITSSIQVGSILYKSADLFQINQTRYEDNETDSGNVSYHVERWEVPTFGENPQVRLPPKLLTDVISAQVSELGASNNKANTSLLENAVRIAAEVCENSQSPSFAELKAQTVISCVYWNTNTNEWSHKGCWVKQVETSNSICNDTSSSFQAKRITCECDHMTHFAVILDTTYINAPQYLDYLTIAGCSISAFFHLAAVSTILCFRHMRKDTHKRIICNISINLFAMNLAFVSGIDNTENTALCNVASFILHFFVLSSWCWMLLEAVYLCNALVIQKYRGNRKFEIVGGILAYVFPVFGATATFLLSGSSYLSRRYCWLSSTILMYAVYVPIGCILGINLAALIAAIYAMACGFKMKSSNATDVGQTMRRIVYMIFLLGLPWVFGLLTLLSDYKSIKEIFSVLFAVSNMLQGIVIFLAFCVTDEKFRNVLRSACLEPMHPFSKKKSFTVQTGQQAPSTDDLRETTMTTNGENTISTPQRKKRLPFRSGWH